MDIKLLSKKYYIKKLTNDDVLDVYNLCITNPKYYKHCNSSLSIDSIKNDMLALPPNTTYDDKYYLGVYDENKLIAVVDLILNFPKRYMAFIGFFMVLKDVSRNGIGSVIIKDIEKYLSKIGYTDIRLGYVSDNEQSKSFWYKNKYVPTGIESKEYGYTIVFMNKKISNLYIPNEIKDIIKDMKIRKITKGHRSGDLVYNIENKYILKISKNILLLEREKNINDYLSDKIMVSKSIYYTVENGLAYYLKSCLSGTNLIDKKYISNPKLLAKLLAKGIKILHSIDVSDCPFINEESNGNCFVHGDYCLPNILAKHNKVSGFIDMAQCGIGDPWIDYAWCIWSYEYNLNTKEYTYLLLNELKIEFCQEKYDFYIK